MHHGLYKLTLLPSPHSCPSSVHRVVSLGFFDNIIVPRDFLLMGSTYLEGKEDDGVWAVRNEDEDELYYYEDMTVRFKVHRIRYAEDDALVVRPMQLSHDGAAHIRTLEDKAADSAGGDGPLVVAENPFPVASTLATSFAAGATVRVVPDGSQGGANIVCHEPPMTIYGFMNEGALGPVDWWLTDEQQTNGENAVTSHAME